MASSSAGCSRRASVETDKTASRSSSSSKQVSDAVFIVGADLLPRNVGPRKHRQHQSADTSVVAPPHSISSLARPLFTIVLQRIIHSLHTLRAVIRRTRHTTTRQMETNTEERTHNEWYCVYVYIADPESRTPYIIMDYQRVLTWYLVARAIRSSVKPSGLPNIWPTS